METILSLSQNFYKLVGKRLFDLLLAIILLPLIIIIIIITGIILFLVEHDKIFFKQIRVGKLNKPFLIWKFRTMTSAKNDCVATTERNWPYGIPDHFVFKENLEDPRITKLGKWLRQLSIDELPQYFNVIKGDMSFIGPRPEVPAFTKYYNDHQNKRLDVKPGITGWAQVNGRSNISHGEKIEYDRYYVEQYSFKMDLKILWKTVINILKREGAY